MSTPPDESELERYTTRSAREINYYLRQLAHDAEPVMVHFAGDQSLLTVLLDIDEDAGMLLFDWGGAENMNTRLLQCPHSVFVCSPHGIRHQFSAGKIWKVDFERRPAFATRLPGQFVRLQRRDYFRLHLPLTQRLTCSIMARGRGSMKLPIVDIGIGGIGIEQSALPTDMAAGSVIAGARIALPGQHDVVCDVELRYTAMLQRGERHLIRIGFAFQHPTSQDELVLQRYLNQIQHEIKARLG